jgi:hypothetical protein
VTIRVVTMIDTFNGRSPSGHIGTKHTGVCCILRNHEKIEISTSGPFYMELVSVAHRQIPATHNLPYFIVFFMTKTQINFLNFFFLWPKL